MQLQTRSVNIVEEGGGGKTADEASHYFYSLTSLKLRCELRGTCPLQTLPAYDAETSQWRLQVLTASFSKSMVNNRYTG